ncbi:hypothetical protein VKT23_006220 [Stygiomarasmius scandens]|uniref:G protein-coupled receptor n=1 Tax=Marasmiellus scandens TaxID=2682957 RepID=A0ABR1JQZ7_9AGAR
MPDTEGSITSVMFILGTEYLLYGVYAVLFIFSLVVLRHRKAKKLPNNGIHFLSMIILFLITTLTTIMHSIEIAYSVSKLDSSSQPLGSDSDKATRHPSAELWRALIGSVIALSFTANFISDILIIYRMYLIWGKRKKVVTIPLLASCCNHAFAIYATAATVPKVDNIPESSNQTNLFKLIIFGVNVAINLVVTLLNAGKIYMITRHASEILNTNVKRTYYNALAIMSNYSYLSSKKYI